MRKSAKLDWRVWFVIITHYTVAFLVRTRRIFRWAHYFQPPPRHSPPTLLVL
jgi:hypothetical protein